MVVFSCFFHKQIANFWGAQGLPSFRKPHAVRQRGVPCRSPSISRRHGPCHLIHLADVFPQRQFVLTLQRYPIHRVKIRRFLLGNAHQPHTEWNFWKVPQFKWNLSPSVGTCLTAKPCVEADGKEVCSSGIVQAAGHHVDICAAHLARQRQEQKLRT